MKICIAFLSFGKDVFGGIENAVYNLSLGMMDLGIDVIVYAGKAHADKDVIDGIRVFRSSHLQSQFTGKDEDIFAHYAANQRQIGQEFTQLLRDENPDYVLAIDHLWGVVPMVDVWGSIRCPVGLAFHVTHNIELLEKVAEMPFAHLFSVSSFLIEELKAACVVLRVRYFHLLPNSIQVEAFASDALNQRQNTIFCSGRLSPEKGVEFLVLAFIEIAEKIPSMTLQLCGGEFPFGSTRETRSRIEEILNRSDKIAERVKFLPALRWEEVPGFLGSAKVAVLPTQKETFGLSALEALASGTPLVTTRVGNLPDLVQDAAILVEYGSVQSIVDAVLRIVSDESLALRMAKKGKGIAAQYDNILVARNFLDTIGG